MQKFKKGIVLPFLLLLASVAFILGAFFVLDNNQKTANQNLTANTSLKYSIRNPKEYNTQNNKNTDGDIYYEICEQKAASEPFTVINDQAVGSVTLQGLVLTEKIIDNGYEGRYGEYNSIYFVVPNQKSRNASEQEFFAYYYEFAKSNSVNIIKNEDLYFRLGLLQEGNKIDSSSIISNEAKTKIITGLKNGKEILLSLKIVPPTPRGASFNYSFACEIS